MLHQLRIYSLVVKNKSPFLDRFNNHAARLMKNYGFSMVQCWFQSDPATGVEKFLYLLEWPNEEVKQAAWNGFLADPEWAEIKKFTAAVHGDFVTDIEDMTIEVAPTPSVMT